MISATHFVEIISVQNGKSNTTVCGGCQIPGTGSWSLIGAKGENWFNSRQSFGPGDYRLTYLGGTIVNKVACKAVGDFSWYTGRVAEPISSMATVDITKWKSAGYGTDTTKYGQWKLDSNNQGISQLNTGQVSFYISDTNYIDQTFTVACKPGSPVDNRPATSDVFGVAWGMSTVSKNPDSYYILNWNGSASHSFSLMRVVNSSSEINLNMFNRLLAAAPWTDGTTQIAVVEQSGYIPWVRNQTYTIQVTYGSDGSSVVSVLNNTGGLIWSTTYQDAAGFGTGRIAFYNLDQENVHYALNLTDSNDGPMYTSPPGSVCTAGKTSVSFSGNSDDVVVLYHADDTMTVTYDGVPGDPMIFNLPSKCILVSDTGGFLIGSGYGVPNAPRTAKKTFISGSNIHVIPAGTSGNQGTGHVSDFTADGYTVINWGDQITIDTLHELGWVDPDGTFRFLFSLVPCGYGDANIISADTAGTDVELPVTPANWVAVEENNGSVSETITAPTVAGDSINISISEASQIGVNLIASPGNLTNPKFQLVSLPTIINNPKVVSWVQENPGGRNLAYQYTVTVGGRTYSTESSTDNIYFNINGGQWNLSPGYLAPLSSATITFFIPRDVTDTTAVVATIINGMGTNPSIKTVKVLPRTVVRTPLTYNRDLLDSSIVGLTAQIAAYRTGINSANYTPYLYVNGRITQITWDSELSNGNTLVCVSNDVSTSSDQIVNHLQTSTSILPRRYVQSTS